MRTLVLCEHFNDCLSANIGSLINAAAIFTQPIDLLIIGGDSKKLLAQASNLGYVEQVLFIESNEQYIAAETITDILLDNLDNYNTIIAAHSTIGKELIPRLAAKINVMPVSDVVKIIDHNNFVREMYAGNIVTTVSTVASKKLISIRTTCFAGNLPESTNHPKLIECKMPMVDTPVSFIHQSTKKHARPDLGLAEVVVAGGRALQSAENFQLLEQLADILGGAVGATRAAVDAGYIANEYQVGQTGRVVAPQVYFAIGISGAIQHIAGIKGSKTIIAINKDPDAEIFKVADYGLVGDLFEIVPELIEKLSKN